MEIYSSHLKSPDCRGTTPCSTALLIIDPQKDFYYNDSKNVDRGALAIEGSYNSAVSLANFINTNGENICDIYVTLDSHQNFHISHKFFWTDKEGRHPEPLKTVITKKDFGKKWFPSIPSEEIYNYAYAYIEALEKNKDSKKYDDLKKLIIWPEHCLIGTKGHTVVDVIANSLSAWEKSYIKAVRYIIKGNDALTEHYSAFKAEVPLPSNMDPTGSTGLAEKLLKELLQFDKIIVAGQAKSHCVNLSVRDLISYWKKMGRSSKDIYILDDAMNSVTGFEEIGKEFIRDMRILANVTTTTEIPMPLCNIVYDLPDTKRKEEVDINRYYENIHPTFNEYGKKKRKSKKLKKPKRKRRRRKQKSLIKSFLNLFK